MTAETPAMCGNRLPISGECIVGCGGFGGCRRGNEGHIRPRPDLVNPLTGALYQLEEPRK